MHILIVHQAFAALNEAGGTRHIEMAHYLVERGHQVTVIASPVNYLSGKTGGKKLRWVERTEAETGLTILRTYTYPAFHRSFVHRVLSFVSFMISSFLVGMSVRRVDVVWGTSPNIFQGVTAWLLARLKRAAFLFEVRDLWPAFAIAVGVLRNPLLIRLSLWLEGFLYRRADRVMVNSPGFIQHVSERGARCVELVPNGADPDMFTPDQDGFSFRRYHGLEDRFLIVYAGAHGLSNDLGVVLEAARLLAGNPAVQFVLVGDGKEKPALQQRAQSLGLENVLFLPPVAKEQMAEVLAAADACLAILKPLELYKTTYPNKVFDSMAAGRPVLLAIDGVIRAVVEQAGAGIFVPPGDSGALARAAADLAAHPEEAREMGRRGRAYVEQHFNRAALTEQLAGILEEMAQKSSSK